MQCDVGHTDKKKTRRLAEGEELSNVALYHPCVLWYTSLTADQRSAADFWRRTALHCIAPLAPVSLQPWPSHGPQPGTWPAKERLGNGDSKPLWPAQEQTARATSVVHHRGADDLTLHFLSLFDVGASFAYDGFSLIGRSPTCARWAEVAKVLTFTLNEVNVRILVQNITLVKVKVLIQLLYSREDEKVQVLKCAWPKKKKKFISH